MLTRSVERSPSRLPHSGRSGHPLRIGVEAHVVRPGRSGNGRVVANLLEALPRVATDEVVAYFTDAATADQWRRRRAERLTVRLLPVAHPALRIPFELPVAAARDRLDILLAHDNRPPISPCPVVTLVHDVAFARHPESFRRLERAWMPRTIPWSIRRSAHVLTVSEFTRREIVDVYGVPDDRITVAPNGVDPVFLDPAHRRSPVDPPFFLAAGRLDRRKNLATLLAAYRGLLAARPDTEHRLLIVGQAGYGSEELSRAAQDLVAAGRVVFLGFADDQALVGLMRSATAFAYPSVYEGFGLPPLEAMGAGCPAVVSDIPVMREVVGDAAVRVPARSPDGWTDALLRLADDGPFREAYAARGRQRAATFTWDRSARIVAGVLQGVAGAGPNGP